jgi:hypothetical protein
VLIRGPDVPLLLTVPFLTCVVLGPVAIVLVTPDRRALLLAFGAVTVGVAWLVVGLLVAYVVDWTTDPKTRLFDGGVAVFILFYVTAPLAGFLAHRSLRASLRR